MTEGRAITMPKRRDDRRGIAGARWLAGIVLATLLALSGAVAVQPAASGAGVQAGLSGAVAAQGHAPILVDGPYGADGAGQEQDALDSWGRPETLQDHFDRHGAEFGAADIYDYAAQAHALYHRPGVEAKVDAAGTLRIYDPASGAFGAYNPDGTTKTFFRPRRGQAYFDRQPGRLVER